jgi:hypothetical protein
MDSSKSFMYVISSDERTNSDEIASFYNFNLGALLIILNKGNN